jgi:hypothetical protein
VSPTHGLQALICHDDWDKVASCSGNSDVFTKLGARFWDDAAAVLLLLQPISDAIHQFEADRPLLSQVLKVWATLNEHAKKWTELKVSGGVNALLTLF